MAYYYGNYPSECNKSFIRELETCPRFFGSSPIGRMCAHCSVITDDKIFTLIISTDVDALSKGAVCTLVDGIQISHACTVMYSKKMECRPSDIQIYPPMGNNFKGNGNFSISNWQVPSCFCDRRHC
ncbi:hypothetical protein TNCV_659671 [Trichonephila clavipes]|nr:hypothetical protein TNCV_659671 [Trichonephila clavipes]